MLFSQFLLKAGMLWQTELVPLAALEVLVRHLPPTASSALPSREGNQNGSVSKARAKLLLCWFPR